MEDYITISTLFEKVGYTSSELLSIISYVNNAIDNLKISKDKSLTLYINIFRHTVNHPIFKTKEPLQETLLNIGNSYNGLVKILYNEEEDNFSIKLEFEEYKEKFKFATYKFINQSNRYDLKLPLSIQSIISYDELNLFIILLYASSAYINSLDNNLNKIRSENPILDALHDSLLIDYSQLRYNRS